MHDPRSYGIVTGTYWVFTLTDGALRMLVLLFLHDRGFSPLELATLFLLYEACGVVTNFLGGWIGTRFGLKSTLFSGLALQIAACCALAFEPETLTVAFTMAMQGLAGVAKDLTKLSAKSYMKLIVPGGGTRLLRFVAVLTGSKNALKGAGFFAGGVLLDGIGFRGALIGMATALLVASVFAMVALPAAPGRSSKPPGLGRLLSRDSRINWLAASRLFLFGSRDVWFVVALPVFLASELSWSFAQVGAFLALWVIGYGIVQASAPKWVGGRHLVTWTASLLVPLAATTGALAAGAPASITLIAGLAVFGFLFATNSTIHSYLIVEFARRDRLALDVGFYYMANAGGRLVGTLLSGVVFQAAATGSGGLIACLTVSMGFVLMSSFLTLGLRSDAAVAR